MSKQKLLQGFTLIELIVVIALMGIVLVIGANIFVSVLRSNNKVLITTRVREEGNRALDLMGRSIQNAASLYYPTTDGCVDYIILKNKTTNLANVVGGAPYSRFTFVDGSGTNDGYVAFNTDATDPANLASAGLALTPITPNSGPNAVDVDPSSQFCVQFLPTTTIVKVNFTLNQSRKAPQARKEFQSATSFQSTFTLRAY